MTWMTDQQRNAIALRIASESFMQELAASRALGYSALACYENAFTALEKIYAAAFEPGLVPPLTRFRRHG